MLAKNFFEFLNKKEKRKMPFDYLFQYEPDELNGYVLDHKLVDFKGKKFKKLPDNLTINGNLMFHECILPKLPENLKVNGELLILGGDFKEITHTTFFIKNKITILDSGLKKIPDNWKINFSMSLSKNKIKELPKNLEVGNSLWLDNNLIENIPENLKVKGFLNLINNPIAEKYSKEEIKKMVFDKGGFVVGVVI